MSDEITVQTAALKRQGSDVRIVSGAPIPFYINALRSAGAGSSVSNWHAASFWQSSFREGDGHVRLIEVIVWMF